MGDLLSRMQANVPSMQPLSLTPEQSKIMMEAKMMGDITFKQFKKWNILVWQEETIMQADRKSQLEEVREVELIFKIFHRFNIGDNPLETDERQAFIREKNLHTSMSVGDCVGFEWDGNFELWSCLMASWKLLKSGRGKI
jgi:hypothetical protein